MSESSNLVTFRLTEVKYDPSDPVSLVLAIASLLPIALLVAFPTLILFRRDLRTITFFAGQLANEGVNMVLKRWLGEPRPAGSHRDDYGMPSSHAQFSGFFVFYLVLLLQLSFIGHSKLVRHLLSLLALLLAVAVCASRTYLGYHTFEQVFVGVAVSLPVALVWYFVVDPLSRKIFAHFAQTPLNRHLLLIRDTSQVADIILFEFENVNKFLRGKKT